MTAKIAAMILGVGIFAEGIMVIFLFATGGVALTPLDTHQELHPQAFGIADAGTEATVQAARNQLTAVANGTPAATVPGRTATSAVTVAPPPVGQSVLVDGIRYTVNNIADPEPPGFFKPPAGKRFVAVEVTIEAVSGSTPYGISTIDLRADDGKDYGWTNGNNTPVLASGTLQAGQAARGWVTIQLPSDAKLTGVIAVVPTRPKVQIADLSH
jgi:Domain of unknown function (DUF4352)